jgi:hypothetical protein
MATENRRTQVEVRLIPAGWQHPRDDAGAYQPLMRARFRPDPLELRAWGDHPPRADEYMPPVAPGEGEIAAYDAIGVPVSPAFPNTGKGRADLIGYCIDAFVEDPAHEHAWDLMRSVLFRDASYTDDNRIAAC